MSNHPTTIPPKAPHPQPEPRRAGLAAFLPHGCILLQSVLYGIGDPISKAAFAVVPLYSLLSARYVLALVFLLLLFHKRVWRGLRAASVRDWLLPSLCIAGGYLTTNIAITLTTATATAFLRSLSTVMTPLLAFLCYRRTFGKQHLPVFLGAVVGLYLLCGGGSLSGFGLGEWMGLLSALLLAGSLVFGEHALGKVDAVTLTTVQTAMTAGLALVCTLLWEGGVHLETAGLREWGVIVYLAILCTVAGYLLQNAALGRISSRLVALLQCTGPVMTALFSRLILGETLTPAATLGAALLLVCVVVESLIRDQGGH